MKKLLSLSLATIMIAGAFSSCTVQKKPQAPTSTPPTSASAPVEAPATPVEITWWAFPTFGTDSGYEKELVDAFQKEHPEVTIKLTTIDFTAGPEALASAIEAGTAPDVLFDAPGRIIEYGRNGKLVKLDDMFTADFVKDVNNDGLIEACKADGVAYMYPLSVAPFYMGINKEAFEKADALKYVNLEGDRSWTTENFVKACEALAQAKATEVTGIVYCGAQGGDQGTRGLVNNLYSSSIVDKDGKWTIDATGVKALTLLQDMSKKKTIAFNTAYAAADELQAFQNGTAAMSFCWGTSNAKTYASDAFTQISVPFPSDDGKPALEFLANGFCVFDNKDDARAQAAKAFVQFICDDATYGPQSVIKTNAFPVRSSFGDLYAGDAEKTLLASWTQNYGPYYNTRANFAVMRTEWWNMLQRVYAGGDVAKEVEIFNTKANELPTA